MKLMILLLSLVPLACQDDARAWPQGLDRVVATKPASSIAPGTQARIAVERGALLLCTDPNLLDFALDAAKYGNAHDARFALSDSAFFSVAGPARLEVKKSALKSRWPKVLVTIVDGESAGLTGWALLSEIPDLKAPAE